MSLLAGWWFRPDYIINDININSVISSPAHDEVLSPLCCNAVELHLLPAKPAHHSWGLSACRGGIKRLLLGRGSVS